MKCPACDKKAIGFYKWSTGKNAIETHCGNCDEILKANWVVYFGIFILICITIATLPFVNDFWTYVNIEPPLRVIKGIVLIPAVVIVGGIIWGVGGYKLAPRLK